VTRSPIIAFRFIAKTGTPSNTARNLTLQTYQRNPQDLINSQEFAKKRSLNVIFNNLQVESGLLFYGTTLRVEVSPCLEEKFPRYKQRPIGYDIGNRKRRGTDCLLLYTGAFPSFSQSSDKQRLNK
jgi:hypothetical protein